MTIRSPSRTSRSRSTPCVDGCCGPMLSTMSWVASRSSRVALSTTSAPAPTPTTRSVLRCSRASRGPSLPGFARHSPRRVATSSVGAVSEPFDPPGEPWVRVSPQLATLRRLLGVGDAGCWSARRRWPCCSGWSTPWLAVARRRRRAWSRSPGAGWSSAAACGPGATPSAPRTCWSPAGCSTAQLVVVPVRPDAVRRRDRRAAGPPVRAGDRAAAHRRRRHRRPDPGPGPGRGGPAAGPAGRPRRGRRRGCLTVPGEPAATGSAVPTTGSAGCTR